MAYIKYCDYINGHDDTGDGSAGNPYKTITKASTGLTGGDEVRVAKSPAPIDLAGTLSFTQNNTAVVSTSAIFVNAVSGGETDGSVRLGDFIKGGDGNWWEVITVTDSTHATLYKKYSGATQSGVSSQKLGITSTGAASSSTQVQEVSASGTSSSKLKISGGWDLSSSTQNGQTYFRQMHGTFDNRYGYGLYLSGKNYVEIERCHFLRYRYGIYLSSSSNNTITTPTCNNNTNGIYLSSSSNNTITTPTCNSNTSYSIYLYDSSNNTITTPTCNSNNNGIRLYSSSNNNTLTTPTCNSNTNGIYLYDSSNNTITTPTCNSNNNGIYLSNNSSNNIITTPTCNNNTSYGICLDSSPNNIANKYSGTGNSTDVYVYPTRHYGDYPCLKCQHFKTAGVNKCFYEYGTTERDTANARSGECLKYTPTSATYYISQSFFFKADSGVSQTLSAYIKDDASFNGDVQAAIYFMGEKITGWTEWTPTTSYAQKSIVASSGSITEDGVLELKIKVRGSAGNVYVDDISAS